MLLSDKMIKGIYSIILLLTIVYVFACSNTPSASKTPMDHQKTINASVMNKQTIKELSISYLKKYAEKDIEAMQNMFADDIILRDWKIRVVGKERALAETAKNFKAAETIDIDILATYQDQNTVAAELKITVDDTEELYVVDVISFNEHGLIKSIRAYKGRGDD